VSEKGRRNKGRYKGGSKEGGEVGRRRRARGGGRGRWRWRRRREARSSRGTTRNKRAEGTKAGGKATHQIRAALLEENGKPNLFEGLVVRVGIQRHRIRNEFVFDVLGKFWSGFKNNFKFFLSKSKIMSKYFLNFLRKYHPTYTRNLRSDFIFNSFHHEGVPEFVLGRVQEVLQEISSGIFRNSELFGVVNDAQEELKVFL
jgi:hypothetical protein